MLACGPAFFFSAFLWSFSLPLPLGGGAGFWVLFFLGLSGLPCSFTAGSHWPNRAGLGLRWCPFPYPVPKTAHRATQGRVWFSPLFPGALLVRQGCQTLGSNAFMHSLFNTSFGKPHSLFPPPQILR